MFTFQTVLHDRPYWRAGYFTVLAFLMACVRCQRATSAAISQWQAGTARFGCGFQPSAGCCICQMRGRAVYEVFGPRSAPRMMVAKYACAPSAARPKPGPTLTLSPAVVQLTAKWAKVMVVQQKKTSLPYPWGRKKKRKKNSSQCSAQLCIADAHYPYASRLTPKQR